MFQWTGQPEEENKGWEWDLRCDGDLDGPEKVVFWSRASCMRWETEMMRECFYLTVSCIEAWDRLWCVLGRSRIRKQKQNRRHGAFCWRYRLILHISTRNRKEADLRQDINPWPRERPPRGDGPTCLFSASAPTCPCRQDTILLCVLWETTRTSSMRRSICQQRPNKDKLYNLQASLHPCLVGSLCYISTQWTRRN